MKDALPTEVQCPGRYSAPARCKKSYIECWQQFDVWTGDKVPVEVDGLLQLPAIVGDSGVNFREVVEQSDDLLSRPVAGDAELVARPEKLVPEVGRLLLVLLLSLVAIFLQLRQLRNLLLEAWN